MHTGDFKVDYTPVFGDAIDLQRFAEIGRKAFLHLCAIVQMRSDRALPCLSVQLDMYLTIFLMNIRLQESLLQRLHPMWTACSRSLILHTGSEERLLWKAAVWSMLLPLAAELGYLHIPDNTLIEIDQVKNYPDEQLVLITTGSQGESMAALSRMAANIHKKITIKPNDTIIFSSNPIPGNEKAVSKVINELSMKGAKVIFQDAHVSGHACQEEIKLIYSLVKPKYAIPVHGEYRHLTAQKHIVEDLDIPRRIFLFLIRKCSGDG